MDVRVPEQGGSYSKLAIPQEMYANVHDNILFATESDADKRAKELGSDYTVIELNLTGDAIMKLKF